MRGPKNRMLASWLSPSPCGYASAVSSATGPEGQAVTGPRPFGTHGIVRETQHPCMERQANSAEQGTVNAQ